MTAALMHSNCEWTVLSSAGCETVQLSVTATSNPTADCSRLMDQQLQNF